MFIYPCGCRAGGVLFLFSFHPLLLGNARGERLYARERPEVPELAKPVRIGRDQLDGGPARVVVR